MHDVVGEARAHNLQQVEALVVHAQASVAHSRGDYQRAVHLACRSLELTTNKTSRERFLGDTAAAYAGLGMRDTARDGYSIVAMTSPHQWVRWQATLDSVDEATRTTARVEEGRPGRWRRVTEQLFDHQIDDGCGRLDEPLCGLDAGDDICEREGFLGDTAPRVAIQVSFTRSQ